MNPGRVTPPPSHPCINQRTARNFAVNGEAEEEEKADEDDEEEDEDPDEEDDDPARPPARTAALSRAARHAWSTIGGIGAPNAVAARAASIDCAIGVALYSAMAWRCSVKKATVFGAVKNVEFNSQELAASMKLPRFSETPTTRCCRQSSITAAICTKLGSCMGNHKSVVPPPLPRNTHTTQPQVVLHPSASWNIPGRAQGEPPGRQAR